MKISFSRNIFSKPYPFLEERGKEYVMVIMALLVGMVILVWSAVNFLNVPGARSQEATLALVFKNEGQERIFTGEVKDGMTVLDALIASSEAGQITLKYKIDESGRVKITGLNGYYGESSSGAIIFYLDNNIISEQDINKTAINSGDKIEIQIE